MSSKYRKLTEHLASCDQTEWTASFAEIEQLLGSPLPDSARTYQAWWSNQMRSQSLSWQTVGWKTTNLNLSAERVTFTYVGGDADDAEFAREQAPPAPSSGLTIAQAKAGLAASFGVDPSQIEITIKG